MTEKFQPKTLAQFSVHQMEQVMMWAHNNGVTEAIRDQGIRFTDAFYKTVETAQLDERGKPMNERGRERLRLALTVLARLTGGKEEFKDIIGPITVWQVTPNPNEVEVRWTIKDTRYPPSLNRTFQKTLAGQRLPTPGVG